MALFGEPNSITFEIRLEKLPAFASVANIYVAASPSFGK
jgi:hypothetical protein